MNVSRALSTAKQKRLRRVLTFACLTTIVVMSPNADASEDNLRNHLYGVDAFRRVIDICNVVYPCVASTASDETFARVEDRLRTRLLAEDGTFSHISQIWFAPDFAPSTAALVKARSHFNRTWDSKRGAKGSAFEKVAKRIGTDFPSSSLRSSLGSVIADRSRLSTSWARPFRSAGDLIFAGAHRKKISKYIRSEPVFETSKSTGGPNIRVPLKSGLRLFIFEPRSSRDLAAEIPEIAAKTYYRGRTGTGSCVTRLLLPSFNVSYEGDSASASFKNPRPEFGPLRSSPNSRSRRISRKS